jgi:hypothetical protein
MKAWGQPDIIAVAEAAEIKARLWAMARGGGGRTAAGARHVRVRAAAPVALARVAVRTNGRGSRPARRLPHAEFTPSSDAAV